MKNFILLLSAIFLFSCQPHSQNQSIVGTWKLVSGASVINGDSTLRVPNYGEIVQLKSWSKETFVFAGKTINNNKTNYSFGNGEYTLQGNQYTEMIHTHVSPSYEGINLKLHIELDGDTLTQIFPVKNDWTYDKKNYMIEKYVRVK